ncbi:hypothetical protein A2159_01045 [Candidatus Woesebacteria bacterium RBG_13_34_9]|uniref:Phosphoglycerate mutase n=1 Tax=Candidatus Woesebacteria bacterium RBG_13_34_9 TaxID=1802477 RepID=A0A1F7X6D7_9BACT|nr:MAG: hypothetical protein A2159_01045 [Candidatus Woesebacteria bacterium RBG_13_34_9]
MLLYIFRHAITYHTKTNTPYGDEVVSAEILPEGIPAIEKLAKYLKYISTDANYTSPYKRCIQTVEIVSEISGKSFQLKDVLGEYREDKETFEEFAKRVKDFLVYLEKQNIKSAAICTHGGVIAGVISFLTKNSYTLPDLHNYPAPGILVTIENGKLEYKDFNPTSY